MEENKYTRKKWVFVAKEKKVQFQKLHYKKWKRKFNGIKKAFDLIPYKFCNIKEQFPGI